MILCDAVAPYVVKCVCVGGGGWRDQDEALDKVVKI